MLIRTHEAHYDYEETESWEKYTAVKVKAWQLQNAPTEEAANKCIHHSFNKV